MAAPSSQEGVGGGGGLRLSLNYYSPSQKIRYYSWRWFCLGSKVLEIGVLTPETMHNLNNLKERRKHLRNFPTAAEAHLWKHLRAKQLWGRKFRRQHSVGRYVLDFYCPGERLAIELDGGHHQHPSVQSYDTERTNFLLRHGIRVLRFTNEEAIEKTDWVLRSISELFSLPPPAPSLPEGRYIL